MAKLNDAWTLTFRVDADSSVGYGHLERCLTLSKVLTGARIAFALKGDDAATRRIAAAGFEVLRLDDREAFRPEAWLGPQKATKSIVLLDVSHNLDIARRAALAQACDDLRQAHADCVIIDGYGGDALVDEPGFPADMVIAPYPGVTALEHPGLRHLRGPDYAILAPTVSPLSRFAPPRAVKVLLTFGGSDPCRLTEFTLAALKTGDNDPAFTFDIVLGPGISPERRAAITAMADGLGDTNLLNAPPSLWQTMQEADISVTSTGLTKYELAFMGVPALFISVDANHARSHAPFDALGTGENLGIMADLTPGRLFRQFTLLANDPTKRQRMSDNGRRAVDGRGAQRVADAVQGLLVSAT